MVIIIHFYKLHIPRVQMQAYMCIQTNDYHNNVGHFSLNSLLIGWPYNGGIIMTISYI